METYKRTPLWDNYKFILILLVVIGHCVNYYTSSYDSFKSIFIFIYAFHMPAFIFISGYFHKNTNIAGKVYGFISMGFFILIALFIVSWLTTGKTTISLFSTDAVHWYMFALAAFIAFTYLTRKIKPAILLIVAIIIACFTGYDSSIGDFLYVSRFLVFLPFYLGGYCLSCSKKKDRFLCLLKSLWIKILSWLVIVFWALLCISKLDLVYALRPLMTGRNPFSENMVDYGCLYRLLCMILSFILIFAIYAIMPKRQIPFVSNAGKNTLAVYSIHKIILILLVNLCNIDVLCGTVSGKIIWVLAAVLITVVLSLNFFSKPINAFMNAVKTKHLPLK